MQAESNAVAPIQQRSLVARTAARFGIDADKMLSTLKATAFKQSAGNPEVTNEQMLALLVVAEQHGLNPFVRQIFAFSDKGGIVPVVSVDGWARIINEHPQFDGMRFDADAESCTCVMFRRDRSHAVEVTEYMSECKRNTSPWNSHPRRMLRHKAMIQCARIAFGFAGIYDEDEAARIVYGGSVEPEQNKIEETRKRLQRAPSKPKADDWSNLPPPNEAFHVEPTTPKDDAKAPTMVDGQTGEIFDHIEAEKNEQA